MLRKISIDDARVGMFIEEVCGNWLDTPYWQTSFLLDTPIKLQTLKKYGVQEVWIDSRKGIDVMPDTPTITKETANEIIDSALRRAAGQAPQRGNRVSFHEEIDRARRVHVKAKATVMSMFRDMREGRSPQLYAATDLADEIISSMSRNPCALLSLAQSKDKDEYVYQHAVAVGVLMIALGRQLGVGDKMLRSLGVAGLMHDAGHLLIPDDLLNKPQNLTDDEFRIIRTHPQLGFKILEHAPGIDEIMLDVCLHHHERMDGAGYPHRLPCVALSLPARMGAVCEVYDSIISDHPYRRGMTTAKSIRKMVEWQDGLFDLEVFHAFVKAVGIYPTGTLVKLRSGRLAVVVDQVTKSLLTPIVKVFFSTKSDAPIFPELLDLSKGPDALVSIESPAKWGAVIKNLNVYSIIGI